MFKLPLFVTKQNKYLAGSLMYGLGYIYYYVTNHFPFFHQHYLPLTWVDRNVPFLPYSVLIYISEYIYFAFVYILLNNYDNMNRYLYAFFALQMTSCTIFLLYPTTYPRENFPIPEDIPLWLQSTWIWLRGVDAPGNCLPSLHVSTVFLSALYFWTDNQKKMSVFCLVWASAIALSTLTTKQHYLADVVAGITLAFLTFSWFHFRQGYKRIYGQTVQTRPEVAPVPST